MTNLNYEITQAAETRFFLKFNETNAKGEILTIELTYCKNNGSANSLPNLWYKKGHTDRVLDTYWSLNTYVKDSEGNCYGKYNPTAKGCIINFDWLLEATEENKQKLINETYKLFINATGMSATEEKRNKVIEYAKKNNLEVVTEIPKGWIKANYVTDPAGSVTVCNTKWSLKAIKEGTYQRKLLLVV